MGSACANAKAAQEVPKIKVNNNNEQEKPFQQSNSSKFTEPATTKITILSKQVSNTSTDGQQSKKTLSHRTTLNSDEIPKKLQQSKNPGKEQLLKQREFILGKFLSDLQIVDKNNLNDILQMLKIFLSHLESSSIYWCKVWLISKNDYSIIVGYSNNVGEIRKIRILYTRLLDIAANSLDNYYYFQQFNTYKIYDYSFRLNKRLQNYYIFSEQEYCDTSLEQSYLNPEEVEQLLLFLLTEINKMHQNNYTHSGIKPSNLYQYLDSNCKKQFKLDVSFQFYKFSRRKQKIKDRRVDQVDDLEDIAVTIINIFFKGNDVRQQLKRKNTEFFSVIINQLYNQKIDKIHPYLKNIMLLLNKQNQYLYDLKSQDFVDFINAKSINCEIPDIQQTNSILYFCQNDIVSLYNLTSIRNQKSLTLYQLITHDNQQVIITPGSEYLENGILYFAYQDMIGCIELKLCTEQVEDTIEILQTSFKQILAAQEKYRIESASPNYQLYINQTSPTTQQEDKFRFANQSGDDKPLYKETQMKESQNVKQISKYFYDRTYFTQEKINDLFSQINTDQNRNAISVEQLQEFLDKHIQYIDNSLITMLNSDRLIELFKFFCDKRMNIKEFEQIFKFKNKSIIPIYSKVVKPLKNAQNVKRFCIFNDFVYSYDGQFFNTEQEDIEVDYEINKLIKTDKTILIFGRKDGCLYLTNLEKFNTVTSVKVPQEFGVVRFNNNIYGIQIPDKLIVFNSRHEKTSTIDIPGLQPTSQLIYKDSLLLFIDRQTFYRVFISKDKYAYTKCDLVLNLQEWSRFDSKLKIQTMNRSSSSLEQIGNYLMQKQVYPVGDSSSSQFRLYLVQKENTKFYLIQRIVFSEFESFDDSYSICKYLDPILLDFFLTIEQDGRVRLNYIVEHGELFDAKVGTWQLMKRCIKQMCALRINQIFIQDIHPNNIIVYQDRVLFTTLINKVNFPSIFSEKIVPINSQLEYLDPKTFQGATENLAYNSIFQNPSKSNIYSLGMIFLRQLSSYQIKNTKEQPFYLMEITQALQQLNVSVHLKSIIEEMLKENEEQRADCYGILQLMKRLEEKNRFEIQYQQQQISYLMLNSQQQRSIGFYNNSIYYISQDTTTQETLSNIFLNQDQLIPINLIWIDDSNVGILVKIKNKIPYQYKQITIKISKKLSGIVDFQQFVDVEDEDEKNGMKDQLKINVKQNIVAQQYENCKDIDIPIFEYQNVLSCPSIQSGDDCYYLGFEVENGSCLDCFIYIAKRQLFKRIGQRTKYFDAYIIEINESFYLFQKSTSSNRLYLQIINKQQPVVCQQLKIKIKNRNRESLKFFYQKHQNNVVAICCQPLIAFLINIETFKAVKLTIEWQSQQDKKMPELFEWQVSNQMILLGRESVLKMSIQDLKLILQVI